MRVLLVSLPNVGIPFTPLNLLYLAGELEKHGIECDVVDWNIIGEGGVLYHLGRGYDVIGISFTTLNRWQAFDLASYIRVMHPKVKIAFGGVHATLMSEQCKRFADVVIKGDGEGAFTDYCQGKTPVERIMPIDSLTCAYHKLDLWRYPGKGFTAHDKRRFNGVDIAHSPRISVQTSRGCLSHCRFCSSFWVQGRYRMRNPELVVNDLVGLYSGGFRHFYFIDDSFYLDKAKGIEFCTKVVRSGMRIAFRIQTRADMLDADYCEALREAGCYYVAIGVETGSERLLETMHKSAGVSDAEKAIRACRKAGIRTEALLIIGNEGETDETIEDTRKFLKRVQPTTVGSGGHGLWLFPGTAVYNQAVRNGEVSESVWDTRLPAPVYRFSPEQIEAWERRLYTYGFIPTLRYHFSRLERRLR